MIIFITGTDTDVGKTVVSSWLCLHTGYKYYKPIQTGSVTDKETVSELAHAECFDEKYLFKNPVSPHLAAMQEKQEINLQSIQLPISDNLVVEGAGGILVPLNRKYFMIDLIEHLALPVILVSRSSLGTINHTMMSIMCLRSRNIEIIGVIICGTKNADNEQAISFYGNVDILAILDNLSPLSYDSLSKIQLPEKLKNILQ